MKRLILTACAAAAALLPQAPAQAQLAYSGKRVIDLGAQRTGCIGFKLQGVSVADPSISNEPWFGLATNHPNFSSLYAILLSSTLAGRTVSITTDGGGTTACGFASVWAINLDQ